MLASCSYDNGFRTYTYDAEDDWILASKIDDAHLNTVWQCCFDDTGTHLFTVGADALLKVCLSIKSFTESLHCRYGDYTKIKQKLKASKTLGT